jgi:hypothetical protein
MLRRKTDPVTVYKTSKGKFAGRMTIVDAADFYGRSDEEVKAIEEALLRSGQARVMDKLQWHDILTDDVNSARALAAIDGLIVLATKLEKASDKVADARNGNGGQVEAQDVDELTDTVDTFVKRFKAEMSVLSDIATLDKHVRKGEAA